MTTDEMIAQHTLNWIRSFIIAYNICPFAKQVVENGTLNIEVIDAEDTAAMLEAVMIAVRQLDEHPHLETTLLVLPAITGDFYDYLDLAELADTLLFEHDYEGVYQLATFHPQYCFAGVLADDVTNFTNRSPYPMLHILREDSVEKAIAYHGNTEDIPDDNIATMRQLGMEKMKKLLQSIS